MRRRIYIAIHYLEIGGAKLAHVHVSPHATLCGGSEVGEGTWIGAGCTVIQGIKIGRWSVIGAGSVVVDDIPDNVIAYGNPAKVIRTIHIAAGTETGEKD